MELSHPPPDLSLQISPPDPIPPHPTWINDSDHASHLDCWSHTLNPNHLATITTPQTSFHLPLSIPPLPETGAMPATNFHFPSKGNDYHYTGHHHHHYGFIRGAPVYHSHPFPAFFPSESFNNSYNTIVAADPSPSPSAGIFRSRLTGRFPAKRSLRAPRMRWTSSLHARFIHAVELLGGHERATPKSVLELMDVKDLTLAHVKSHLQMYRTVKTTDKPAISSGHQEGSERGHGGEVSDEFSGNTIPASDYMTPRESRLFCQSLWSNSSSGGAWLQAGSADYQSSIPTLKEKSSSPESSTTVSGTQSKSPNLDFTLGRPD